jgi:hypothetical protein
MKKLSLGLLVILFAALFSSCKTHHRCAAYSQADVPTAQKPS